MMLTIFILFLFVMVFYSIGVYDRADELDVGASEVIDLDIRWIKSKISEMIERIRSKIGK